MYISFNVRSLQIVRLQGYLRMSVNMDLKLRIFQINTSGFNFKFMKDEWTLKC